MGAISVAALVDRGWRGLADVRRRVRGAGSARTARAVFGRASGALDHWLATTADRHDRYRQAIEPLDERVAIVCVSNRPRFLSNVADNVLRQSWSNREFVLVANGPLAHWADVDAVVERLRAGGVGVRVIEKPGSTTLGECLNVAIRSTDARIVAKFDDDDRYGPEYLTDALRAHRYSGAGVVGKHTYYAMLASSGSLVLRFPMHEYRYSGTLAGGTLVIDRERSEGVEFPSVSLGEDREFLRRCHRRGVCTFAADRFNFLQMRAHHNTWQIDAEAFMKGSVALAQGLDQGDIARIVDR